MELLKLVASRQKTTGLAHFIRYSLVSGVALAVDVSVLVIGYKVLSMNYLVATTLGFMVGVVVNYSLSILWVFSDSRFSRRSVEFTLTAGIAAAGLVINDAMMWLFVEKLAVYYLVAKLVAATTVFFWNFVIRKYYVHATPVSTTD